MGNLGWSDFCKRNRRFRRTIIVFATVASTLGLTLSVAHAEKMYWSDPGTKKIHRADLDGSNVEDVILRTLGSPVQIALDLAGGKMYWTDVWEDERKIQRANLDGSQVEDLVTGGMESPEGLALDGSNVEDLVTTEWFYPEGIALDLGAGKMYWTEHVPSGSIHRANLDGSNRQVLIPDGQTFRPQGIALDLTNNKMYWTDAYGYGRIQRANLDGSEVEELITDDLYRPLAFALDLEGGKMYWTEAGDGYWDTLVAKIRRANLDGSQVEDIIILADGDICFSTMALDLSAGRIYWWDTCHPGGFNRANLDGTNVEVLIPTGEANGIALDLTEEKMYWTGGGMIHRSNLDGSATERLAGNGFVAPYRIAFDPMAGKIYMGGGTSYLGGNAIRRMNLDGSEHEVVVDETGPFSRGIALDVFAGKIYWTVPGNHGRPPFRLSKIWWADFDGANVEDIVTLGYGSLKGVAVDPIGGHMYWTSPQTHWPEAEAEGSIRRARLDGSNVEQLVTGLVWTRAIALDLVAGKIYWTERSSAGPSIRRADFDGSNVEVLVTTGLDFPNEIALDVAEGKMYWIDSGTIKIQRANLDGSQVEDLVTVGLESPEGIALDVKCGNGIVDSGEACDIAIPSGEPGFCLSLCHDYDTCTRDLPGCTVPCRFLPITAVIDGDGCCPPEAGSDDDSDCAFPNIPAVSEWGLLVTALLLLTGAKILFGHRPSHASRKAR